MNSIKITLVIATLVFASITCQAQEKGEQKKKENKIAQQLNLSPEQTQEMKTLRQNQKIQNKAFQEKMAPVKEQMKALKAERKAMNETKMKEIESILTPEQFVKFKELKANRKENRKNKK